jgi:hypothetical protein
LQFFISASIIIFETSSITVITCRRAYFCSDADRRLRPLLHNVACGFEPPLPYQMRQQRLIVSGNVDVSLHDI